jgi:hypothetical protein
VNLRLYSLLPKRDYRELSGSAPILTRSGGKEEVLGIFSVSLPKDATTLSGVVSSASEIKLIEWVIFAFWESRTEARAKKIVVAVRQGGGMIATLVCR